MSTVATWVQLAIRHPVPDRVKPLFVIFDIWALWCSDKNDGLTRSGTGCMRYSCTHDNSGRQKVKLQGAIKKFSAWPSSAWNKIKAVFGSYSSKAQNTTCATWLLSYEFLYISAYEQTVCQMVSRMLTHNCAQVSEELLERYRRDPAKIYFTTRYSGWNVYPPLQFWVRTTKHVMERRNRSKFSFHYTAKLRFFHVICKQPTTAKMHKIFIAQKSYCACHVLSLATIRSKHYFNFILNRTRSGQELFDRPSYNDTTSTFTQRDIWGNTFKVSGGTLSVQQPNSNGPSLKANRHHTHRSYYYVPVAGHRQC